MRSTAATLIVAIGVVALQGCGGSDASTSAADSGSDGSTTSTADTGSRIDPDEKCYFTGDFVVDGVARGMRASGCSIGSTNAGVVLFGMSGQQGLERLQIQFYLDEPVAPGYTGPIRVKDVKVNVYVGGGSRKWVGTSCTLAITRNESDAAFGDASVDGSSDGGTTSFHFRAWGTGACSMPFTPDSTGTLSVGAYELMFDATR